ncbi:MAG: transglutaminase domain-containing protein [Verrucomicrobiota bacterium]
MKNPRHCSLVLSFIILACGATSWMQEVACAQTNRALQTKETVVVETNSAALVELPSGMREETYALKPGNNAIPLAQLNGPSCLIERVAFEGEGVMPFFSVQGRVDWTDPETIVHSVVKEGATDKEKAFALYRFALGRFANLSMHNQVDITRFIHSLGYGYCSTQARVFQCLLNIAGIPCRMPDLPGHATTEVYFENAWHNLDPYVRCYFLKTDGETIASCADVKTNTDLLLRHVDADGRFPRVMIPPKNVGSAFWFNYKGPGAKPNIPWTKETFCLRRGEKITFLQERKGYWCHAISEPPDYANGLLDAKLVTDDKDWRNQFEQVENITTQRSSNGIAILAPEDPHKSASLIYQCISPFLLATGEVVLRTSVESGKSAVRIEIQSPVTGPEWLPVPLNCEQNEVKADLRQYLSCQSVPYEDPAPGKTMAFNYRLRISIDALDKTRKNPAGICAVTMRHMFQYFPPIIPECVHPADVLLVKGCKGTGAMTLTLREQAGLRVSKEQPFENEEVHLTALVHNRGTSLARNVVVRFYDGDPDRGGIGICNDVVLGEIAPGKSVEAKSIWQAWLRPEYPGHGWSAGYFRGFGNYAALVTSDSPDFPPSTALCPPRTYKDTWLYARIACADVKTRLLNSQTRFRVRVQQRPSLVITPDYVVVAVEQESVDTSLVLARATVRYIPQSNLFMYQQHNGVKNISVSFILVQCEGNREIIQQKQDVAEIFPSEHAMVTARFEGVRLTKGKYMLRVVVNPNENILSRSRLTAEKEFVY